MQQNPLPKQVASSKVAPFRCFIVNINSTTKVSSSIIIHNPKILHFPKKDMREQKKLISVYLQHSSWFKLHIEWFTLVHVHQNTDSCSYSFKMKIIINTWHGISICRVWTLYFIYLYVYSMNGSSSDDIYYRIRI